MSRFSDEPLLKPLPGSDKMFVLQEEFSYEVGFKGSKEIIKCVAGFITDFASIPRLFRIIISVWGRHGKAAIVHDKLYWDQKDYNRKQSDDIFLEAMTVSKVSCLKRYAIYWAVRSGGWLAWKNNKKAKARGDVRIVNV